MLVTHLFHQQETKPKKVVVVFHNEGFTTLMRTVHSVINYSPSNLIHEIVLIDDGSTRDHIVKVNMRRIKLDPIFSLYA